MRRPALSVPRAAAVLAGFVTVVVAAVVPTMASAASYPPASYADRLLTLVNAAREQYGLRPLAWTTGTTTVATSWTQQMAAAGALSHNPDLAHQLAVHGSKHWGVYGENVGVGSADAPDDLFQAYMKSPEHRANILEGDYRYVGVAVLISDGRAWNTFDFVDAYRAAPGKPAQADGGGKQPTQQSAKPTVRHLPVSQAPTGQSVSFGAFARPTRPAAAVHALHSTARPPVAHLARRHGVRTPTMPVHPTALHARPARAVLVPSAPVHLGAHLAAASGVLDVSREAPAQRQRALIVAIALVALAVGARRWTLLAKASSVR